MDGASQDDTLDILKKYPHLQWISEPDRGQSDAMNKAFSMSTGEIILYLNADDCLEANIFKTVVDIFTKDPQIDLLIGALWIYFSSGERIKRIPSQEYEDILQFWLHRFPANPVCYYYQRGLQEQVGPFPIENHYTMDYWFLLRAYKKARIYSLDRVMGSFFLHEESKTQQSNIKNNLYHTVWEFLKEEEGARWRYWFLSRYMIEKIYLLKNRIQRTFFGS